MKIFGIMLKKNKVDIGGHILKLAKKIVFILLLGLYK